MTLSRKTSHVGCGACLAIFLMITGGHAAAAPDILLAADTVDSNGSVVDDSMITAKVKSALIADDTVKALDINVKTRKGEVVLSGSVDNVAQADRAIQIATNVDGVKSVSNRLSVNNK